MTQYVPDSPFIAELAVRKREAMTIWRMVGKAMLCPVTQGVVSEEVLS